MLHKEMQKENKETSNHEVGMLNQLMAIVKIKNVAKQKKKKDKWLGKIGSFLTTV